MSDLPIITDHIGVERKLGYKFPTPQGKLMRASNTDISKVTTVLSTAQWKPVDYVTGYPTSLITDQGQLGACVGFSCTGANARMRFMRTGKVIVPSGFYCYDQINGGQDNGAVIDDAQSEMLATGAPPLNAYPKCLFRTGQNPSGVPFYKEDVPINITSSNDAATALMLGWLPQMPIEVDNTFQHFTSDGVAWGGFAPRGNNSNHSIYLAGLKQIGSTWYFMLVNSWSANWGPFGNGTCLIPTAAIDNPAMTDDAWCHINNSDPDDIPPAVT